MQVSGYCMACGAFCKLQKTAPRFGEREAWSPTRHTTPSTHNCGAQVIAGFAVDTGNIERVVLTCERCGAVDPETVTASVTECVTGPKRCIR